MMLKHLGMFGVLAVCLFAMAMVGCGPEDPPLEEEEPVKFISADPVAGSTIQNDATITVTFDGMPAGLEVTGGNATLGGKTVSIAGPFDAGSLTLGLKWEGDAVLLSYTVEVPPPEVEPEEEEPEEEVPPVVFIEAVPVSGSTIQPETTITVLFDGIPLDVSATHGTITVIGSRVTITGPFAPGNLILTVFWDWDSDRVTLRYTVIAPDTTAPRVTGGTLRDGDIDVDPAPINTDGKIEFIFSEEVFGNIALQTEAGDDVGWVGKVEGTTGTLELVKGRELANETTYVIAGKVSDAAGNAIDVSITFVTRIKFK